jgi:hypothetical protein
MRTAKRETIWTASACRPWLDLRCSGSPRRTAHRDRMGRYCVSARPCGLVRWHGFQPPTTQPSRTRLAGSRRLHLGRDWPGTHSRHSGPGGDPVVGLGSYTLRRPERDWPGTHSRHSGPGGDPVVGLGSYTLRRPGQVASVQRMSAKNMMVAAKDLSLFKIEVIGTGFGTGRLSHYGHSVRSSWASRSASASFSRNRGLAFHAMLPRSGTAWHAHVVRIAAGSGRAADVW